MRDETVRKAQLRAGIEKRLHRLCAYMTEAVFSELVDTVVDARCRQLITPVLPQLIISV